MRRVFPTSLLEPSFWIVALRPDGFPWTVIRDANPEKDPIERLDIVSKGSSDAAYGWKANKPCGTKPFFPLLNNQPKNQTCQKVAPNKWYMSLTVIFFARTIELEAIA